MTEAGDGVQKSGMMAANVLAPRECCRGQAVGSEQMTHDFNLSMMQALIHARVMDRRGEVLSRIWHGSRCWTSTTSSGRKGA